MKVCTLCKQEKPLSCFAIKDAKGCLRSACKECENAKRRRKYASDEEYRQKSIANAKRHTSFEKVKAWRDSNRDRYLDLKKAESHRYRRRNGMQQRPEPKHEAHVKLWQQTSKREQLHQGHVVEWKQGDGGARFYRWRYTHDEEFRLKERLRRQLRKKAGIERIEDAVRASIHGKSARPSIERLLGYSMADLKVHLERQFRSGMNWKTYGRRGWHIDHIRPKRCFDLTVIDGVRAFWALQNLRPLPARENIKKHESIQFLV